MTYIYKISVQCADGVKDRTVAASSAAAAMALALDSTKRTSADVLSLKREGALDAVQV